MKGLPHHYSNFTSGDLDLCKTSISESDHFVHNSRFTNKPNSVDFTWRILEFFCVHIFTITRLWTDRQIDSAKFLKWAES